MVWIEYRIPLGSEVVGLKFESSDSSREMVIRILRMSIGSPKSIDLQIIESTFHWWGRSN